MFIVPLRASGHLPAVRRNWFAAGRPYLAGREDDRKSGSKFVETLIGLKVEWDIENFEPEVTMVRASSSGLIRRRVVCIQRLDKSLRILLSSLFRSGLMFYTGILSTDG